MNNEDDPNQLRFEMPVYGLGDVDGMADRNGASMDPYVDGGLYDKYIQEVVVPMLEEGQVYHPAPEIVEDTLPGFDQEGNYHAVPNPIEALGRAITPYRWASYLQDAVTQYISTMDYTVGSSERYDIAQDIVSDRMERAATNEERMDLEDALQIWFRTYRYGIRD